ncbi:hypothetical protein [Pelosinus sp. IPA-1]|uniref:hypothetical protein n=1 Tax=Pelosinus sp. IPA-1 TaxID=3029569 RepID=UPI0024362182|nr:hypothetical protein [Pelosinus sp. IPA-1]GMB00455.1 hypothetical protein PIPA1_32540 [Pelosinus sp. IPA-1]
MELLGYAAGAFFGLVTLGVILYITTKLLGGIKWALIATGLLALMALYRQFPILTIILGLIAVIISIAYKFTTLCSHCNKVIKDKNNSICPHCNTQWGTDQ